MADYYKNQGHQVDIIAGGKKGESDYVDNVTRINCPYTIKSNSNGSIAKKTAKLSIIHNVKVQCLKVLKKVYRSIFWPDGLWHWLPFVLFAVLLKKNKKYDLVIGYSPTFSAVLSAHFYKFFNNSTRLILDFGDPFSVSKAMPVNNYLLYKKINHLTELNAFRVASKVTFTNEKTYKLYHEKYPKIEAFSVSPHLVDVDLFYKKHIVKNVECLRFGYVGAFHKGIREPGFTINVLEELKFSLSGFTAIFYGPLNGVQFKECESLCHKGIVQRKEAVQLLQSFDILIHVENEDCPMSPSKINEYIALGKPVINFLSKTNVSSFDSYPLVFDVSAKTDIQKLKVFIVNNARKQLARTEVESLLEGCALSHVANSYLEN
ncbi:MAG: hypothetical protein KC484_10905 [Colwelliaceae bacterium]|nr:hypothetical protein [Colwelliaceae bacterium]